MTTNRPKLITPVFLLAAVVLLTGWAGVSWVTKAKGWKLVKRPAVMRRALYLLPERIGTFVKSDEQKLSHEMEQELGASQYLLRTMTDGRSRVRLHVAFHTGWPDAGPNVSRTTWFSRGEANAGQLVEMTLGGSRYYTEPTGRILVVLDDPLAAAVVMPAARLTARRLSTEAADAEVFCFYIANGSFLSDPLEVRAAIMDPLAPNPWWCRVEVQPLNAKNPEEATAMAQQFTSDVLPEILASLPGNEVKKD